MCEGSSQMGLWGGVGSRDQVMGTRALSAACCPHDSYEVIFKILMTVRCSAVCDDTLEIVQYTEEHDAIIMLLQMTHCKTLKMSFIALK